MIWKLLVSTALCAWIVPLLVGPAGAVNEGRAVIAFAAIVLLGWHRVLLPSPDASRWVRLYAPTQEKMSSLDTLWGIPIRPPRVARVTLRAQRFTETNPRIAYALETLPIWLCQPLRRLIAHRHDESKRR